MSGGAGGGTEPRSWLFVPGDGDKKLGKADATGADALMPRSFFRAAFEEGRITPADLVQALTRHDSGEVSHLGVVLLAAYAAGLGVPFLLVAASADAFLRGPFRALRRTGRVLQFAAGGVMVAMGAAMITGHLTDFAVLVLRLFPSLGSIG